MLLFLINVLLFVKIETEDDDEDEDEGSDTESVEPLDLSRVTEMRLVPSDASQCNFSILSVTDECFLWFFMLLFLYFLLYFLDVTGFMFDAKY